MEWETYSNIINGWNIDNEIRKYRFFLATKNHGIKARVKIKNSLYNFPGNLDIRPPGI